MNIVSLLEKNSELFGEKICFNTKSKSYSYSKIRNMVGRASERLKAAGISKNDGVILLEPISVRLYVLMMALWAIGAYVIVFDPSATPEYIEKCLSRVKPRFFIGSAKAMLLKLTLKPLQRLPSFRVKQFYTEKAASGVLEIEKIDENSTALVTFTSGSTGIPKVAVRTHGFLIRQYEVIVKTMDYAEDDVDLAVLPVFTLVNMARGITTAIPAQSLSDLSQINPKQLIRRMADADVTRITTSPMLISIIADYAAEKGVASDKMRRLNIGGGPVYPFTVKNTAKAFPNAELWLVYGSTEAEPIAEIKYSDIPAEYHEKTAGGGGLVGGFVVSGIDCRVIKSQYPKAIPDLTREEFDVMTLKDNVGEIVVSGGHVLGGYLDGIGDDENKFNVEEMRWHRTGDLGRFDENGCLWLLGRSSAAIGDTYPFAVESAVYAKYKPARCALVGIGDRKILAVEGSDDVAELIQADKTRLKIDEIVRLEKIPLDVRHRSKIDYGRLGEMLENSF